MKPTHTSYKHPSRLLPSLALTLLTGGSCALFAEKTTENPEVITVEVRAAAEQSGKIFLTGSSINLAPSSSGGITDALRVDSSVQFDLLSRNSMTGGEIAPPKISIQGARHYENNFIINGVGNNNNMNPSGFVSSPGDGPQPTGDSQGLFLDTDNLESLTVYTSNVPAQYGSFLGGVIDAKLRAPRTDGVHGTLKYRATSDNWAKQHYTPVQIEDGADSGRSTNAGYQPEFYKHEYSASVEGALMPHVGMRIGYGEQRSTITLYGATRTEDKTRLNRINRNATLHLATHALDSQKAELLLIAAPYESENYIDIRKNSSFLTKGGGYTAILSAEKIFTPGKLSAQVHWQTSEASRDSSSDSVFTWKTTPDGYANWGTLINSFEGTMGDYTQKKTDFGLKSSFAFATFGPSSFRNTLEIGGELSYVDYKARHGGAYTYNWQTSGGIPAPTAPQLDPAAAGTKENGVIAGEQWLNRRAVYAPATMRADATQAAIYIEDVMEIKRLTLRPGVRLSYDDITGNTDLSPRFFVNYDTFGNGVLGLTGGANRYYGSQVVAKALYYGFNFISEARTRWDQPWIQYKPANPMPARLGDLKTPYSDEFNIGARLRFGKHLFKLDAVQRAHRDQIRSATNEEDEIDEYTNTGKTDFWGVTLGYETSLDLRWAGKHDIKFSATHSETDSNSRDVNATFDETDIGIVSLSHAFYNGKFVSMDTLPANNFASPYVAVLTDMIRLAGDRLRLYNTLRYEHGGDGLLFAGYESDDTGMLYYSYEDRDMPNSFYYDLAVEYDIWKSHKGTLSLRLEIFNVFDRKNLLNISDGANEGGTYSMGRQFFAGMQFSF